MELICERGEFLKFDCYPRVHPRANAWGASDDRIRHDTYNVARGDKDMCQLLVAHTYLRDVHVTLDSRYELISNLFMNYL